MAITCKIKKLVIFSCILSVAACCNFGSGPSCAFSCNCASEVCETNTGACPQYGCASTSPPEYGWGGYGCLVGNVAYEKSAIQSGNYQVYDANRAVDGNTNTNFYAGSCSHTAPGGAPRAWWQVDLGALHVIHNVTIYNRGDQAGGFRTNKLSILVGRTESDFTQCARLDSQVPDGGHQTFPCPQPLVGRYVKLLKDEGLDYEDNMLNICEVVATGYKYVDCSSCPTSACNSLSGCDGCPAGKKRPDCKRDCPDRTYGVNCGKQCGCRTLDEACDKKIGACASGCPDWFVHEACTVEIKKPDMSENKYKPMASEYTHSTVTITWTKLDSVPDGKYYFYAVEYEGNSGGLKPFAIINHNEGRQTQSTTISGLDSRTEYSFRIVPSRNISTDKYKNMKQEYGIPTHIITQSTVCPLETYGAACSKHCYCHDPAERCHIDEGTCNSGCRDWFVGKACSTEIISPDMSESKYTPREAAVSQHTATITWWKLDTVPVEEYYFYEMEFKKREEDQYKVADTVAHAGDHNMTITINDLEPGISYDVRIRPYRNISTNGDQDKKIEYGTPSQNISIQTVPVTTTTIETPTTTTASLTDGGLVLPTALASNVPAIIGGVVGAVVIVLFVIILVAILLLRRRGSVKKERLPMDAVASSEDGAGSSIGYASPAFREEEPQLAPPQQVDQNLEANNNVYENTSVSLPPVPLADLGSYVEKKKNEPDGFSKEFSKLPAGEAFPCTAGAKETTILKNRFKNIKAYDHSRVVLSVEDGDESSGYINANYITGYKNKENAYVATQGPKPATVNDMWRLIWQVNTNRVVMVTTEYENGKRKCERYWPDKVGESHEYGQVSVTTVSVEEYADYTVRIFSVAKGSSGQRQIMHFHFTSWRDKRIPDYAFPLLSFLRRVRSYKSGARGPLLVHCSAGVGRTGTYLALDYLLQQAETEKQVDVFGYVNLMRTQRMSMVQTLEQYIFVYDALVELFSAGGNSTVPTASLAATYTQWGKKKPGTARSQLEQQFQILTNFKSKVQDIGKSSGLKPENASKNRFAEIYAMDANRPYLTTRVENGTDYINATFVSSYNRQNAILATQAPLPNTVADIWRLVNDHNANCIVMLNEENDMDETCGVYWPKKVGSSVTFDPLVVTLTETNNDHPSILVRDMKLAHNSDAEIPVRQFVLHNIWPADRDLPDPVVICDLVDLVERWQQTYGEGDHTVIIHCINGVERTGLLCACLHIVQKLRVEQEVDIVTSVKHVKTAKTDFISSMAQYKFLYEMVQTYIQRYDTYANFK